MPEGPIGSCHSTMSARQLHPGVRGDPRKSVQRVGSTGARESSGGGKNAGTGSGQDGFGIGTVARTHLALTSSRPGHTRVSSHHLNGRGTNDRRRTAHRTPLVGASALHGVSGLRPEATWAQPLGPGRAVLTRGVSRRSGSVACIRADASPTEVLAVPC